MKWYELAELEKKHIGQIVTIDFLKGNSEQLAVYQSCSERLTPDTWDALFYDDTGPNITALMNNSGQSNWYLYIRP